MSGPGGKRKGAGRKAFHGETKITASLRLTPTVKHFLAQGDDSISEAVEKLVRASRGFKTYMEELT